MGVLGEAWNCPHCGQRILRSAANCPACQRRLRADAAPRAHADTAALSPFLVEGAIHHSPTEPAREYSVLVQIRDSHGAVLAKHMVGVGAIQPGDTRIFTLQVEISAPEDATPEKASAHTPHPGGAGKESAARDDRRTPHDAKARHSGS